MKTEVWASAFLIILISVVLGPSASIKPIDFGGVGTWNGSEIKNLGNGSTSDPSNCVQETNLGTHRFMKLKGQGITLHYVENGDRSKPLILFLHGFPEFWYSWHRQLTYFSRTHWVVAIDMRGYGQSDNPRTIAEYTLEVAGKDILEFVQGLGRTDCILVGHDWGAYVAFQVAAYFPHLVSKLIVINGAHPDAYLALRLKSTTQFIKGFYTYAFQVPRIPELIFQRVRFGRILFYSLGGLNSVTDAQLEPYLCTYKTYTDWNGPLNYYRANKWIIGVPSTPLPKITTPTLVIWGSADIFFALALPEVAKNYVENIQIRYTTANHYVHSERPDQVSQFIEEFVSL